MKKYRKDKSLSGMTVAVRGDDLIGAMRVLKKRMQSEGTSSTKCERGHLLKLGVKRKDFKDPAGRRRWLKKIEKLKEQGK